jgi:2,4-dienoyl-CoA reductase-like NADH-dependent reductase (Old Yellow Enzyme family)
MKKLPFSVVAAVVELVEADIAVALEKSVEKWTSPRRIARTFTECVCAEKGLQGRQPLDQLRSANPEGETGTLIGTHSQYNEAKILEATSK